MKKKNKPKVGSYGTIVLECSRITETRGKSKGIQRRATKTVNDLVVQCTFDEYQRFKKDNPAHCPFEHPQDGWDSGYDEAKTYYVNGFEIPSETYHVDAVYTWEDHRDNSQLRVYFIFKD